MKRNESNIRPYVSKRAKKQLTCNSDSCSGLDDSSAQQSHDGIYSTEKSHKIARVLLHKVPRYIRDTCQKHSNVASTVKWNPQLFGVFVSSSFDKKLILWDASSSRLSIKKSFEFHEEAIKDVTWSQDGHLIYSASFDKTAKVIDAETGSVVKSYPHEDLLSSIVVNPSDTNTFLTGSMKAGIYAWDRRQNKVVQRYKTFFGQIQDLLFLPDGGTFLSCAEALKKNSMDKAIIAWDFKTSAAFPHQIYQEPHTCTRLKLHPNNKHFYAQSSAGYIAIFDANSPWRMNRYKRYEGHQCTGYRIGFDITTDGRYIYSGDLQGAVFIYDAYTTKIIKRIAVFTSPCVDVSCSPLHESKIVCSAWDGSVSMLE